MYPSRMLFFDLVCGFVFFFRTKLLSPCWKVINTTLTIIDCGYQAQKFPGMCNCVTITTNHALLSDSLCSWNLHSVMHHHKSKATICNYSRLSHAVFPYRSNEDLPCFFVIIASRLSIKNLGGNYKYLGFMWLWSGQYEGWPHLSNMQFCVYKVIDEMYLASMF